MRENNMLDRKELSLFFVKAFVIHITCFVFGAAMLLVIFLIPFPEAKRNDILSVFHSEGWIPRATIQVDSVDKYENIFNYYPDSLDYMTDDQIISFSIMDSGDSVLRSAVCHWYPRYWHGYAVFLRPLFLIFSLDEIRIFNCGLQLFLVMSLSLLLVKNKKRYVYAFIPLALYFLYTPVALMKCFQFIPIFNISMIASIIVVLKKHFFERLTNICLLFIVIGIFTSYLDLFTNPLLTYALPMASFLVVCNEKDKARDYLGKTIFTGLSWIFGYAAFWFSKFLLASVILKKNIVKESLKEVFFRMGSGGSFSRMNALYSNYREYCYLPYALLIVGIITALIICLISGHVALRNSKKKYSFLLIGISPIVYYCIVTQHTSAHHFFTYRTFLAAIIIFLIVIVESLNGEREQRNLKVLLRIVATLCTSLILCSIVVLIFCRETEEIHNFADPCTETPVAGEIRMNIKSAHSGIESIILLLNCTDEEAAFLVKLCDKAGNILFNAKVPVSSFNGGNRYELKIGKYTKAGETYSLIIKPDDSKMVYDCYITEDGDYVLGIIYKYLPENVGKVLFLCYSTFGLVALLIFVLGGMKLNHDKEL